MGEVIDIQSRVASEAARQHKPEGISIMVVDADDLVMSDHGLAAVARLVARRIHPDVELTGAVLHIGREELGVHRHEVVLEIR